MKTMNYLFKISPLNPQIFKKSKNEKFEAKNRSNIPTFQQNTGQKFKRLIMNNIIIISKKIIIKSCWNEAFFVGIRIFLGCFVGMRKSGQKLFVGMRISDSNTLETASYWLSTMFKKLLESGNAEKYILNAVICIYTTIYKDLKKSCWNVGMKNRKTRLKYKKNIFFVCPNMAK